MPRGEDEAVTLARSILLDPDRGQLPRAAVELAELTLERADLKHPDMPEMEPEQALRRWQKR